MRKQVTGVRGLTVAIILFGIMVNALIWYSMLQEHRQKRHMVVSTAVQRNSNLCVALEQYTIRTIQNADAILQLLKLEYKEEGAAINFDRLNNIPFYNSAVYNGCAIIDAHGRLVATSVQLPPGKELNFSDRVYFRFHQGSATDSLYISKPFVSRTINQPVITLSRRLQRPDGSFNGVVSLQIAPSTFTSLYAGAQIRANDIISLIAPDGVTYARRTGSQYSHSENISHSPLFEHLKQNKTGSYLARDAIRNIPSYFSYRQLERYPIIATVGASERDVLAEYEDNLAEDYQKMALISLLIILFCFLMIMLLQFRKKSVQRLEASEIKYRSIFENSRDAIVLLQPGGAVLDMNMAACHIFKTSFRKSEALHFSSLLSPEASAQQHILHTESYHEDIPFRRTDGSTFIGEMASASYRTDGGEVIIAIIRDLTERKEMERKLIVERKRRQKVMTRQIIVGQEREREAIGRELHDNINQVLTSAKLYLEMAMKEPGQSDQLLPRCQQLIVSSINDIRNLSHNLSAPTLGTRSLIVAINTLLETIGASSGLAIHFCHENYNENIDLDIKLAIYRIIQEQVNNIIKHSGAKEVTIILEQNSKELVLEITDDGTGFDPAESRKGIGFNNIESRVKMFDGQVAFISAPGRGCRLRASVPGSKSARDGSANRA
ncbi:MAG: PAS domain S-box protein [Chitinophagaceae bacterium]